jgi:hypothetical protein
METETDAGLVIGHAYGLTAAKLYTLKEQESFACLDVKNCEWCACRTHGAALTGKEPSATGVLCCLADT